MEISSPNPPKLLDRMREALRVHHHSCRTEQSHMGWTRRYIYSHDSGWRNAPDWLRQSPLIESVQQAG